MTLNSDDPPMFGTTLTQEYRRAASVLGLDREQLATLAANGVRASFLDSAAGFGTQPGIPYPGRCPAVRPARRGAFGRGRSQHLVGQAAAAGIGARGDGFIAHDSQDLREAVESGRSALRTVDDARAAIIACYVAMENSLAERGTARATADTPDELLARARQSGIVRGTAATRLTALFYEARFSSHPLDHRQRDAAEQALDELAAALAETETAGAGSGGMGA